MSGLELEREVEDWLLDNPLLERPETDEFADSGLNRAVTMPRAGQQLSGDDAEDIGATSPKKRISNTICMPKCASIRFRKWKRPMSTS